MIRIIVPILAMLSAGACGLSSHVTTIGGGTEAPHTTDTNTDDSDPVATLSVRPSALTTGPTPGTGLVEQNSMMITQAGTVVDGVKVNGSICIAADNVTVRNFVINATSSYGIDLQNCSNGPHKGIVIENGEINGNGGTSALIYGSNFTARHLNLHHSGSDGIKPITGVLIESSWIHHLGMIDTSHADGVQFTSGGNSVFRGNYFDIPIEQEGYKSNSAFIIQTNDGPIDNIVISGNWMNGGNWTLSGRDKGNGDPTNVSVTGNYFGSDFNFGVVDLKMDYEWSNNVDMNSHLPIND